MAAIAFDLDGTLIHSAPDIHACLNRVMEQAGAAPFTLAEVTGFIGNGIGRLVARAIEARGFDPGHQDDFEARFLRFYQDDPVALTRPFDGVTQTLAALRAAGFGLGVCTNKPEAPARDILARLELEGYFDVVIGGDSLEQRKPDPAPLLATLARLGGRGLYVGDSEVDAECADRADVPFLLFEGGYRKAAVADLPHYAAFQHFSEVPELARRLMDESSLTA